MKRLTTKAKMEEDTNENTKKLN